jgi:LPS-assembly protein
VTDEESEPSDPPFWRLRAREAERRPEEGSIIYRDVTFDLLGRPILYTPFLSHPDPQAERRSGFLTPNLGQSSELGAFAEIPYHFALDPSYDLTLALNPTTQAGIVGKADWRQRLYSGRYRLRGSIVNTQPEPGLADPPPDTRWNVFGAGAFDITKDWSWGFQAERTSDDTFIRRYDIERPDRRRGVRIDSLGNRLQSDVFLRRSEPTEFIQAESVFFQGLRADDRKETTPSVLPRLQYRRSFEGLTFGIAEVQFDALSLRREDGVDVQRLVGLANWSATRIVGPGVVTRAFAQVQTDLRRADFSEGAAEVEARTLPTLGVELSWPLVRAGAGGTQVIEPVLLALASPVGASLEETPNEDSVSTELDTTNLLRTTRATGFDLIEDGQRAVVALRGKAEFRNDVAVQALIGQVFRLQDNSPYDDDSGLGDRVSDLVGRMSAQLGPHLSTTAAARFDTSTAEIRRADLGLDLRLDRISVRSSYRISRGRTLAGVPDREEFAINGRANINQNWALFGAVRRDIEADRSLSTTLGAQWSNDCTFVSLALSRDTTQDRDLEPDTTVLFRIGLRSLGEFGQGNF